MLIVKEIEVIISIVTMKRKEGRWQTKEFTSLHDDAKRKSETQRCGSMPDYYARTMPKIGI